MRVLNQSRPVRWGRGEVSGRRAWACLSPDNLTSTCSCKTTTKEVKPSRRRCSQAGVDRRSGSRREECERRDGKEETGERRDKEPEAKGGEGERRRKEEPRGVGRGQPRGLVQSVLSRCRELVARSSSAPVPRPSTAAPSEGPVLMYRPSCAPSTKSQRPPRPNRREKRGTHCTCTPLTLRRRPPLTADR